MGDGWKRDLAVLLGTNMHSPADESQSRCYGDQPRHAAIFYADNRSGKMFKGDNEAVMASEHGQRRQATVGMIRLSRPQVCPRGLSVGGNDRLQVGSIEDKVPT